MKVNDDRHDDGKTFADLIDSHAESSEIINDNTDDANDDDDDKKQINSKNGVTNINIDVPDSQNAESEISLSEHEINAKQIASNDTTATDTAIATTTVSTIEKNATNSIGGDAWLRQKQWHRRLHAPIWARCSIQNQFFS